MSTKFPDGWIKVIPEDFIVQELLDDENGIRAVSTCRRNAPGSWSGAPVTLFELVKRGVAANFATRAIARQLEIDEWCVTAHGLKDRHAVTAQLVGVKGRFAGSFESGTMWLRQVGVAEESLKIGGHRGNRFGILVRSEARDLDLQRLQSFPNEFGVQRVGFTTNVAVGRLLLEGRFDEAYALASPDDQKQVARFTKRGDVRAAWLDRSLRDRLKFLVQSWQSELWNRLLREHLEGGGVLPQKLAFWSTGSADLYKHLWDPADFDETVVGRLPAFERATSASATNLSATRTSEGWRFAFDLPKGVYATTALSQLFALREQKR